MGFRKSYYIHRIALISGKTLITHLHIQFVVDLKLYKIKNMDFQVKFDRLENTVNKILEILQSERPPSDVKWLSEAQAMQILNLSKRGIADIRRKNLIRCSSATGRNFLYYKPDLDKYIYDYSGVRKSRKVEFSDTDTR